MAVSVLVVEDDRNIAELLQMYLEKEGYTVTVAADGGRASALSGLPSPIWCCWT